MRRRSRCACGRGPSCSSITSASSRRRCRSYKLPSGKHVIELVNEGKNRREKIEVNLKPGEEQEIKRDWDK